MTKPTAVFLATIILAAVSSHQAGAAETIDVFKSPYCGCCGKWVDHLRQSGLAVRTHEVGDVPASRKQLGMPERYASCHTAKIAAYVIEGHVPAADIQRLLAEKPKAVGLAVPSMPPGSPGMESTRPVPYQTLLVKDAGAAEVFAQQ